ncbi:MAG: hypothetical protein JSS98_12740 [Bacteroidetes bacterium]|nr:hypothetical protein [Bacteroidota bacterium]
MKYSFESFNQEVFFSIVQLTTWTEGKSFGHIRRCMSYPSINVKIERLLKYTLPTLLFVGFFLTSSFTALAQLPQVQTSVDKQSILIGQQFNFKVRSSMPDNTYRLSWFSMPDSFSHFEVVTKNGIDTSQQNGNLIFSQTFLLTNFDSGRQVIPPMMLRFETLNGDSSFAMFTDSILINVGYTPADSVLPFHDIKNILEIKADTPWWYWALAAFALLVILLLIIFRKRIFGKGKVAEALFQSKLSPLEEATQSMDALIQKLQQDEIKVKQFYIELSEIFKRYLSRIDNKRMLYCTSDELLIHLAAYPELKNNLAPFANALRVGDAVKFAKFSPDVYSNKDCFNQVSQMISAIHQMKKNSESAV